MSVAAVLTRLSDLAEAVEANTHDRCSDFCVTGTVTYSFTSQDIYCHLLIEDENIGVDIPGTTPAIRPNVGDILQVKGSIVPLTADNIQPQFTSVEILGHTNTPSPASGAASEIMGGKHDFHRAYLVGEVRDIEPSGSSAFHFYLSLISDGRRYFATVPSCNTTLQELEAFVGSTVRLDGYPDSHNCSFRFLEERRFAIAGLDSIKVLSPPPEDPFSCVPSVSALRHLPAERIAQLGRHKATGTILTIWQGRNALLLMPNNRIAVIAFDQPSHLQRGQKVEVIGYPSTTGFTLILSRALARPAAGPPFADPPAVAVTEAEMKARLDQELQGSSVRQGRRIELCGTVAAFHESLRERMLFQLSLSGRLIDVDFSSVPDAVAELTAGCRVRIRGTCVLATENMSALPRGLLATGIKLVLDKPDDVEILSRPPWWTPTRLAIVVAALLATLVLSLFWIRTLRRLSERRGRELFRERTAGALAELKTEERTRLAVELHDSISQILTGAAMQLDAGEIGAAKRILTSCRRELRSCLWDLRSHAIDATNFADAVRETVAPHLGGRDVKVDLDIPSASLSEELRHAALRIIREAAVNAIRHGHASLVSISGELDGKRLSFTIVDDGRGFDPSVSQGSATGHFGLLGMRERAKAFNGSVNIVSAPGNGTEVSVILEEQAGYDFGEETTHSA